MSEQQAATQENNQTVFNIQRIYLKDMSLEIPDAPHIFLEQSAPTLEINVAVDNSDLAESIYETTVSVTATMRVGDKIAFLAEAKQAGIFQIAGVPQEQLHPIQCIVCANIIYPYLRSNIADIVQRAGFPPIHLQEINFEALYQQRAQQTAKPELKADAQASPASGTPQQQ